MGRKRQENPYCYVDGLEKNKPFAILSNNMALSGVYQNLSLNAKYVLIVCKLCRQYHQKADAKINNNPLYFYFNRKLQNLYGLKNPNKTRAAMCELIENGFLDVVENNAIHKTKNIYAFSGKWRLKENKGQIELSDAAETFLRQRKT